VTLLAALLVSAACWLAMPKPKHVRLRAVLPGVERATTRQLPLADLAAISLGLGIAVLLASSWGMVLGLLAAVITRRLTSRLESREARDRRRQLQRQLPSVCDLLAATLASGAPLLSAVSAVAKASDPPAAQDLQRVVAALRLGASQASAWQEAALGPEFARVSAAFQRSAVSGAPIAEVLKSVAGDERRRRRTAVEVAARSAGVRAVAPLAACFLPAFVLLGIVPVVASMAIEVFAS